MRLTQLLLIGSLFYVISSCSEQSEQALYSKYADPFIGTDGIVHTFPGATIPNGMIQLSPDGDTKGWNWCSGYHYSDSSIMGFSHTHLSGTGWADLGDILFAATTGELDMIPGPKEDPDQGYRSRISHLEEEAHPGYYKVRLIDYNVDAEMTVSDRVGFHRYTFPGETTGNIIIDPTSKIFGRSLETEVRFVDNKTVEGRCLSSGWGGERYVYFTAEFSEPFDEFGVWTDGLLQPGIETISGSDAKGYVRYINSEKGSVEVKVAISAVSYAGARANLLSAGEMAFDDAHKGAITAWERALSKIRIRGATEEQMRIFYTGLYHTMIHPNLNMDVDGSYVAMGKTNIAEEFNNYSSFSLWDTWRAVHPLLTLIDHHKTADFVKSLVSRYNQGDQLPVWELCGFDNRCMIGYPSVAVIADAIMKDIEGFDYEQAYQAMKSVAFHPKITDLGLPGGLEEYLKFGYVTADIPQSVSKTMEFSYYDWCIGQVADKLGHTSDAEMFYKRSLNFLEHFNPEQKLFWPKDSSGIWVEDLSLTNWEELKKHYISGNIWAYSYFFPHATENVIELLGGKEVLFTELEKLFTEPLKMEGEQHVDISGFLGHYGHGDEPGHHIPYLYNYSGKPWKTAERVKEIMNGWYSDSYDGMPNNDDCGQMSAWYIFSALGFYPVCPGDLNYIIGTPSYDSVELELASGKIFGIYAENLSSDNIYVQSVTLNNREMLRSYITHSEIMSGGTLHFRMGPEPNMEWAVNQSGIPLAKVDN